MKQLCSDISVSRSTRSSRRNERPAFVPGGNQLEFSGMAPATPSPPPPPPRQYKNSYIDCQSPLQALPLMYGFCLAQAGHRFSNPGISARIPPKANMKIESINEEAGGRYEPSDENLRTTKYINPSKRLTGQTEGQKGDDIGRCQQT